MFTSHYSFRVNDEMGSWMMFKSLTMVATYCQKFIVKSYEFYNEMDYFILSLNKVNIKWWSP